MLHRGNEDTPLVSYAWLVIGTIAILVGAGLPLFGLQRFAQESEHIEQILAVRSAADDLDAANDRLATAIADFESSGTSPGTRDPKALAAIAAAAANVEQAITRLQHSPSGKFNLLNEAFQLVAATRAYLDAANRQSAALASESAAPPPEGTAGSARAVETAADAALNAAARLRLDDQLASLSDVRRNATVLTIFSSVVLVATFAAFGTREVRGFRRRLRASTVRATSAEGEANERARMVNLASHELRNPLTVLAMSAQIIDSRARASNDTQLFEIASDVRAATSRANGLIAELLDIGGFDAQRLQLTMDRNPLMPVLTEALAATETRRGKRPVALPLNADGGPMVLADAARLGIILRNLVDNAFKHSPPGTLVSVGVTIAGSAVTVTVRDKGPGVPPERTDAIFERFNRSGPAGAAGGIGIGLHLSRELARRMGGELESVADPEGGHFRLHLRADE